MHERECKLGNRIRRTALTRSAAYAFRNMSKAIEWPGFRVFTRFITTALSDGLNHLAFVQYANQTCSNAKQVYIKVFQL